MSEELDKHPTHEPETSLTKDSMREHLELLADSARDLGVSPEQAKKVLGDSTQILEIAREKTQDPRNSRSRLSRIASIAVPLTLALAAAYFAEPNNQKEVSDKPMHYPYAEGQIPPMSGIGAVVESSLHHSDTGTAASVTPEEYQAQFQRYTVQVGDNLATILNHIQPGKFTNEDGSFKTDTETQADLYDNIRVILQHNKSVLEEQNNQLYQKMDNIVAERGRKILPSELKQIVEETGGSNQIINIKDGQTLTIPKLGPQ